MEKIRRVITFTGKNLNDVFGLPCVKLIMKAGDEPLLVLRSECMRRSADVCRCAVKVGEKLVEYDNREWEVER